MILAEDLERLVGRWASLVNEIVDALLPGYQFLPLLKRRLAFEHRRRQAPIFQRHLRASFCLIFSPLPS